VIYKLHIDAFYATPETQSALEQAREYRDLAKSRMNVLPGGLPGAVEYYSSNRNPQLILVEETSDDEAMMEHLAQLAEVCEPGTKVVVIGSVNDINVYRLLLGQGISEYLVPPVSPREIVDTVLAIFADPAQPPRGRMIAFYGARGGAGSSTLAHNVAWSLAKYLDEDVVLLDLDASFGTSSLAFNGIETKQAVVDVLSQPERIDVVLLERFLAKYDDRLQILPSAGDLRTVPNLDVEAVDKLLDFSRQMAAYVVVDVPHVWAPWVDYTLKMADELVLVSRPDLASLRDCKNLVDMVAAKRGDGNPTRVVLNCNDSYKRTQLSAKDFQETLNLEPAMVLPFDPNLFGAAANNGQMIGEANKTSKIADSIKQLAMLVSGKQTPPKKHASLMDWLRLDMKRKKRS
jgi:Flp pilus assembly protein, ATPase CpaE